MSQIDVVTVYHRDENYKQAMELQQTLEQIEKVPFTFIGVDNRIKNVGFSKGCNKGAKQGTSPIIGFLNPDVTVHFPFFRRIVETFQRPHVVIAGENFGKSRREIELWGCREWVCGAAMFVDRHWFEGRGGFDEQFVWGWEETDLIRQAQVDHKIVVAMSLPISHESPAENTPEDALYKNRWFNNGAKKYRQKWNRR